MGLAPRRPVRNTADVISVVVPAHNESTVVGRLLSGLLSDAKPGEFDIVVVANGCTDDTARIAAGYGTAVSVQSLATASKAAALRVGDHCAAGFPRLYVDADVELDTAGARALAAALAQPGVLAVAPRREMVLDGRPRTVRWYYEFWQELPVVANGLFGRGVIGVDAEGKARLGEVPDVLGDDLAASLAFPVGQRRVVADATVRVHAPRTFADLIRRRVRSVTATTQLATGSAVAGGAGGAVAGGASARTSRSDLLGVVRRRPSMALRLPVFLAVTLISRARARRRIAAGDYTTWLRDASSREA
jgi:hypothetical protein